MGDLDGFTSSSKKIIDMLNSMRLQVVVIVDKIIVVSIIETTLQKVQELHLSKALWSKIMHQKHTEMSKSPDAPG
ncbi:hypothetical protein HNY73_010268 [Argiope bruennichi]|uniref:Uncharacterized protein n=1 Tax=Argiope bruennichi TaxID=94029 RepID=A0A8T0F0F7_ARGBR|nr:hypothetical protein HNY73_010268 [Argiope bruennichi]